MTLILRVVKKKKKKNHPGLVHNLFSFSLIFFFLFSLVFSFLLELGERGRERGDFEEKKKKNTEKKKEKTMLQNRVFLYGLDLWSVLPVCVCVRAPILAFFPLEVEREKKKKIKEKFPMGPRGAPMSSNLSFAFSLSPNPSISQSTFRFFIPILTIPKNAVFRVRKKKKFLPPTRGCKTLSDLSIFSGVVENFFRKKKKIVFGRRRA